MVFDNKRRFLAIGLYDPASPIRVRVLQHGQPAAIDAAWFRDRLSAATTARAAARLARRARTNGYRLVHGENDGLPGLVIDRYARDAGAQALHRRLAAAPAACSHALAEVIPAERLVLRLSRTLLKQPEALYGLTDGMILAGAAGRSGPLSGERADF